MRLVIALLLTMLFSIGAALQILSTVNVILSYWLSVIPPLIAILAAIIPINQWLLPISQNDATISSSQAQQPPPMHPTMQNTTSAPATPIWNVPYPHIPFYIGRDALLTPLYDALHNEKQQH